MEKIDARGQACPLPVVRAKKELSAMDAGSLEVLVDNQAAVHNLEALAASLKVKARSERRKDAAFAVVFEKAAEPVGAAATEQKPEEEGQGEQVVVVSAETMGVGDDELGAVLMKGFLFALSQQDRLPAAVLLYNAGVKLACEGSASLDDLRALEAAGVSVMSCGLCLDYFNLSERLAVGEVTNMYAIVEKQLAARTILRP